MPSTTDRPDDSDDPFAVAEATKVAARETAPADRPTEAVDRPTEAVDRPTEAVDRPTEATPVGDRPTVLVDDKALGDRPTVRVPGPRRPPGAPKRRRRAPLPVAVAFATLWAAVLSYLPVAVVIGLARSLEGQGGLGAAAHAGLAGWLLGHGVPIGTSIGPLGLPPLLLSLLIIWRLNRAGLHVTRATGGRRSGSIGGALLVGFAVALTYSLLGSVAALVVDGKGTEVVAARAAINFFVIGLVGALAGSLRGTDALSVLARRTPGPLRHGIRTGVVAALLILAAGAAVTGLSVAVGGGQAADTISAFRTGVAGQAGITLLSLAYGGNAAVWAAAYLLGPGFALGTGSSVSLTEMTADTLPTLPLLAGLPNGPMGAAGAVLLAVPVLAGLAAGVMLTNRLRRDLGQEPRWALVLGSGVLAGPAGGLLIGLLAWFSGGSLGGGRLAVIGPNPWLVGGLAAAVIAISVSVGASVARTLRKK